MAGNVDDKPYSRLPLVSAATEAKGILLSISPRKNLQAPPLSKDFDSSGVSNTFCKTISVARF
jgi:hypothetical protein